MAKLSKMEISAIAEKISEDSRDKNREINKIFKNTEYPKQLNKFQRTKAYKSLQTYISAQDEVKELLSGHSSGLYINILNLENVLLNLFNREYKEQLKVIVPSTTEIERDIIIAQARNVDIDALIIELTEKYSK